MVNQPQQQPSMSQQQLQPTPGPVSVAPVSAVSVCPVAAAPVSSLLPTGLTSIPTCASIAGMNATLSTISNVNLVSNASTVSYPNLTTTVSSSSITSGVVNQPKRLHVSNIPFRFRDPDLRQLFGVSLFRDLC